jgi:FlaA1/EpsC-like NDP-sugar epimerase
VRVPSGVWFIDLLLCLALVAGARLLARTLIERPRPGNVVARGKEVVVVGAGDAAQLVVKEMLRNPALGMTPIGLLDDDPRKKDVRLHGVRVLGATDELPAVLHEHRPDEVLIAIPSASGAFRQRVVDAARVEGIGVKTLPSLAELVTGEYDLARRVRPVEVEDVLGREPVEVDLEAIAGYLGGEVVLVTGAGGSIGSELSRQVARLGPSRLVLLDHAEPALFEIERELTREHGFAGATAVVADVKDRAKLGQVLAAHRPGVVFHAAAYKHVAMMEANPVEAVRNNTLGTRTLVDAAVEHGVGRFVLVSTDKAANPQTVMGQSKALCEWIVEMVGHRDHVSTRFVAVRFGNVLGSSGSVIPIFRRQIAAGGPVTVTHPEMTRFFMTIPEAVQLVVQAGAIGERGQVYVLDMGEPVRILDLAEKMIRLSGKEPGEDVVSEFIGPAPGEKLHEALVGDDETASPSPHEAILRLARQPIDPAWLESELTHLAHLVDAGAEAELVTTLDRIVRAPRRLQAPPAAQPLASPHG